MSGERRLFAWVDKDGDEMCNSVMNNVSKSDWNKQPLSDTDNTATSGDEQMDDADEKSTTDMDTELDSDCDKESSAKNASGLVKQQTSIKNCKSNSDSSSDLADKSIKVTEVGVATNSKTDSETDALDMTPIQDLTDEDIKSKEMFTTALDLTVKCSRKKNKETSRSLRNAVKINQKESDTEPDSSSQSQYASDDNTGVSKNSLGIYNDVKSSTGSDIKINSNAGTLNDTSGWIVKKQKKKRIHDIMENIVKAKQRKIEATLPTYKCVDCFKSFDDLSAFKKHVSMHMKQKDDGNSKKRSRKQRVTTRSIKCENIKEEMSSDDENDFSQADRSQRQRTRLDNIKCSQNNSTNKSRLDEDDTKFNEHLCYICNSPTVSRNLGKCDSCKKQKCSYTAGFKLKVIEFAKEHNKQQASQMFDVSSKQVRTWCANEFELRRQFQAAPNAKKKSGGGRKHLCEKAEKELLQWLLEKQSLGIFVSHRELKAEAISRFQKHGYTKFCASKNWRVNYLRRHKVSLKTPTQESWLTKFKQKYNIPETKSKIEAGDSQAAVESTHSESDDSLDTLKSKLTRQNYIEPSLDVNSFMTSSSAGDVKDPTGSNFWWNSESEMPLVSTATVAKQSSKQLSKKQKSSKAKDSQEEPSKNMQTKNCYLCNRGVLIPEEMKIFCIKCDTCRRNERASYTAAFKLRVVEYAKETSKNQAGRMFDVDRKCVLSWSKIEGELREQCLDPNNQRKRKFGAGRKCLSKDTEMEISQWVGDQQKQGVNLSCKDIRGKAVDFFHKNGFLSFQASSGWCERFLRRNHIVLEKQSYTKSPRQQANKKKKTEANVVNNCNSENCESATADNEENVNIDVHRIKKENIDAEQNTADTNKITKEIVGNENLNNAIKEEVTNVPTADRDW